MRVRSMLFDRLHGKPREKACRFGALIGLVGCRIGMKSGRSATDVGRAATTAVVVGIIGVILVDAIFAVCANALDI